MLLAKAAQDEYVLDRLLPEEDETPLDKNTVRDALLALRRWAAETIAKLPHPSGWGKSRAQAPTPPAF